MRYKSETEAIFIPHLGGALNEKGKRKNADLGRNGRNFHEGSISEVFYDGFRAGADVQFIVNIFQM